MNFEYAYSLIGGNEPPVIRPFGVANSQTLKRGDAVVLASGLVTKADNGMDEIFGIMAEDVTTGGSAGAPKHLVAIVQPPQVWRATATANASTHVLATRTYAINDDQEINVAASTGGCVSIVDLGDTNTDVYVAFSAVTLG